MENLIIGFVIGILIPYVINILNLVLEVLQNYSTLHANKVQAKINELNVGNEVYDEPNRIGFQIPNEDEEYYDDEFEEE